MISRTFERNNEVGIFITAHTDEKREEWVQKFGLLFSDLFGGCTVTPGRGFGKDDKNCLVFEASDYVWAYAPEVLNPSDLVQIEALIEEYMTDARQAFVLHVVGTEHAFYSQS